MNSDNLDNEQTVFQLACGIQSASGLSEPNSIVGLIKKLNSSAGSFPAFLRMLKQSYELKISLWRSNKPRLA